MKYNYSDWYLKHKGLEPIKEYSGTITEFVPDYPPENKPKFIPDNLLNSKHLTQR
jgi:hypothetical protein